MNSRISYAGQTVYIGIDVHKRTYSVSCVIDGELAKRATMTASAEKLVSFLRKHFADAKLRSVYEAGFSGFALHRMLVSDGVENIVVSPGSVEVAARDRVKTDTRDSLKLATQLSAGRLRGITVPSEEQELDRLLTRTREQLVQDRTRLGHRFKSRLYQFGLIAADDRRSVSEPFIDEYLSRKLPPQLAEALITLANLWRGLNEEIRSYRRKLAHQAARDKEKEAVYRSVPGVGPIAARTFANELNDMSQFRNEGQIYSFLGLTPSEFSSGPNRRLGHISRQGSARLRWMLTEAAWRAIKKDPALAETFRRISERAGKKRAIVAIARKLAGRMRACFRKHERYQLGSVVAA